MTVHSDFAAGARRPAYMRIYETLRLSIERGCLPHGTVLLEGPLAGLFNSSRSPVKQALARLEAEGVVFRFAGRGLMVGRAERPLRIEITSEHLATQPEKLLEDRVSTAELYYYEVEREILKRSLFGRFRVNELALARHYDIGRTVARDILLKAQHVGLVTKGEKAHWWIVPLDKQRLLDLYQLRELLEPVALVAAAPHLPAVTLQAVTERLEAAQAHFPDLTTAELDQLEEDLHTNCLSCCPNRELIEALSRTRASTISGKHMQSILYTPGTDSFLEEHLAVVQALARNEAQAAADALLQHLAISRDKGVRRLEEFHRRFDATVVDYIMD